LFFLAPFYIKILKKPKKILIIIQRSNGDVFLGSNLVYYLFEHYDSPKVDLLVNDDTISIASLLPNINFIHQFSYDRKKTHRWSQELELLKRIYRKYDLSINLTASDRSVLYALFSSRRSISAIEKNIRKSWWKKFFLSKYYYYDLDKHILINNSEPLNILNISHQDIQRPIIVSNEIILKIKDKLRGLEINNYIIFHPSAQYYYKIYPRNLRDKLLKSLSKLGVPIIVTGSRNRIDSEIKKEIPELKNIFNFIGDTTLEEYFALSQLSMAYIGMDTLNMHIAASQGKRIFAIFGPTNVKMWSPWSNLLQTATNQNKHMQNYGNVTLFQSSVPCSICEMVGCGNNHNTDEFSYNIEPSKIFNEILEWYRLNPNMKS
jgi:heptosyltransferase-3